MRLIAMMMVACLTFAATGCGWMGRTAGKAEAKMENGVDNMKSGYRQGYSQEKKKDTRPVSDKDSVPIVDGE